MRISMTATAQAFHEPDAPGKAPAVLSGLRLASPFALSVAAHLALAAGAWALRPAPRAPVEEPVSVVIFSVAAPAPALGVEDGIADVPPAPPPRARRRPQALSKPAAKPVEEKPAEKKLVDAIPVPSLIPEVEETPDASAETATSDEASASEDALVAEASDAPAPLGTATGTVDGVGVEQGSGDGSSMGTADGQAVDVKAAAVAPKVRDHVQPTYPRRARSLGVEGRVVLQLVVGRDGRVEPDGVKVLRSIPALDAAAIDAVRQWRFSPARDAAGRAIRVIVRLPVQFSLR